MIPETKLSPPSAESRPLGGCENQFQINRRKSKTSPRRNLRCAAAAGPCFLINYRKEKPFGDARSWPGSAAGDTDQFIICKKNFSEPALPCPRWVDSMCVRVVIAAEIVPPRVELQFDLKKLFCGNFSERPEHLRLQSQCIEFNRNLSAETFWRSGRAMPQAADATIPKKRFCRNLSRTMHFDGNPCPARISCQPIPIKLFWRFQLKKSPGKFPALGKSPFRFIIFGVVTFY